MNCARFYAEIGVPVTESFLLQVLVEIGVIDLLGFMLFVLYVVKTGIRLFRQAALTTAHRLAMMTAVGGVVGLLFNTIVSLSMND